MELEIIRLVTSVIHSVKRTKVAALELIYTYYLQLFGLYFYDYIIIQQIGGDLEFVMFERNKFHVNMHFSTPGNYRDLPTGERNRINLQMMHEGLMRISKTDARMKADILEKIREEIIRKDFIVEISFGSWPGKNNSLKAIATVVPQEDWFDYFITLKENEEIVRRYLIMRGKPSISHIEGTFQKCKWLDDNKFIIGGYHTRTEIDFKTDNIKIFNTSGRDILWQYLPIAVFEDDGNIFYKKWLDSLSLEKSDLIAQISLWHATKPPERG